MTPRESTCWVALAALSAVAYGCGGSSFAEAQLVDGSTSNADGGSGGSGASSSGNGSSSGAGSGGSTGSGSGATGTTSSGGGGSSGGSSSGTSGSGGGPSSGSSGGSGTSSGGGADGGSSFACGPTLTCDPKTQYCSHYTSNIVLTEAGPGADYSCEALPDCDASDKCSCFVASGVDVCTCKDTGGELTRSCSCKVCTGGPN